MASGLVAPEVPQPTNLAAPFLSAFYAAAQINNKRRALENQVMKMQMQEHFNEQKLQVQAANYASLDASRAAEANAANARANAVIDKAGKANDHADEIVQFQTAISNIDADPGTKDYMTQLNVVRSQFPRLLATPDGQRLWSDNFNTHKYTAGQMVASQKAVAADYIGQMKAEKLNPYWMENPDQWDYVDKNGQSTTPDKATTRVLKLDASLQVVPPNSPKDKYVLAKTLPVNRFDQYLKQHEAYKGIVNGIITGQQEPDASNASGPPSKIKVEGPDGNQYMLPSDQLNEAIRQGYKPAQ